MAFAKKMKGAPAAASQGSGEPDPRRTHQLRLSAPEEGAAVERFQAARRLRRPAGEANGL